MWEGPLVGNDRNACSKTFGASPTRSSGNCAPRGRQIARRIRLPTIDPATGRIRHGRPTWSSARGTCSIPMSLTLGFARRFATYKRPESPAARSGAAASSPDQPSTPGATHRRRESASGRPVGAGADSGVDALHLATRGARARRFFSATTTCSSRSVWCRAWTSGSTLHGGLGKPVERAV